MASQASKPKDREERTELDFFFQIMTTVKGKKEDICLSKTHTHTHKVFFFFSSQYYCNGEKYLSVEQASVMNTAWASEI